MTQSRAVEKGYVLTIEALQESRIYTAEGMLNFFKADLDNLVKVAAAAIEEGFMELTLTHMGGQVSITRVLAIGGYANGSTNYTVYRPQVQVWYS